MFFFAVNNTIRPKWINVAVGLLCVSLVFLVAGIRLRYNFERNQHEQDQLKIERDLLKTEKDQLKTERDQIKTEGDQLKTEINHLTTERDHLLTYNSKLIRERDELLQAMTEHTNTSNLSKENLCVVNKCKYPNKVIMYKIITIK